MNKFSVILPIVLSFPVVGFAQVTCPTYFPNKENKLLGVGLFDKVDKIDYELAPTEDKTTGDRVEQTWVDFDKSLHTQTFVHCKYLKTEQIFTKEIGKTIKSCRFNFPLPGKETEESIAEFHCE